MPIPPSHHYAIDAPADVAFEKLMISLRDLGFEIDRSERHLRAVTASRPAANVRVAAKLDESTNGEAVLIIETAAIYFLGSEGSDQPAPWEPKPSSNKELEEIITVLGEQLGFATPRRIDGK